MAPSGAWCWPRHGGANTCRPGTRTRITAPGYSARRALGGGPVHTLSHPLDYLRWLLGAAGEGDVATVQAVTAQRAGLGIETEDVAAATLVFDGGALATVALDFAARPPRHDLYVVGSEGSIRWDFHTGEAALYRASRGEMDDGRAAGRLRAERPFSGGDAALSRVPGWVGNIRLYAPRRSACGRGGPGDPPGGCGAPRGGGPMTGVWPSACGTSPAAEHRPSSGDASARRLYGRRRTGTVSGNGVTHFRFPDSPIPRFPDSPMIHLFARRDRQGRDRHRCRRAARPPVREGARAGRRASRRR